MFALSKDIRLKTFCDWVGVFCFLGCFLATVGLSCFGVVNVWEKSLCLEAIDALFSMLKLLAFNCGLLLASWAVLHTCSEIVLLVVMGAQSAFILISAVVLEAGFQFYLLEHSFFLDMLLMSLVVMFPMALVLRLMHVIGVGMQMYPMPFVRRAISKGVTLPLLLSYALAVIFIATAALGMFGLLAGPASVFGKIATSVVACGTILILAVAARLLRVLYASKIVHSRILLDSLHSRNLTTFIISQHLGSTFFYYALLCIPIMAVAILCISIDGWHNIIILTNIFTAVAILSFPIYDAVCGTRMLILKKSIWDEWCTLFSRWTSMPTFCLPSVFLQDTGFISSFGALLFARIFGLRLFGNAQVLNPYSILTCTAICLANNLLFAKMAADAPTQIGIYLNARHAADLVEVPESELTAVARGL